MARYSIDEKTLTDIADAVRAKSGVVNKYEMDIVCETTRFRISFADIPFTSTPDHYRVSATDIIYGENTSALWFAWGASSSAAQPPDTEWSRDTINTNYIDIGKWDDATGSTFHLTVEALDADNNIIATYYTPTEMAEAIDEMMGIPDTALCLTGNCSYRFSQNGWNWFIKAFGDKITTQGISNPAYMFSYSTTLEEIPFDIYLVSTTTSTASMFQNCNQLIKIPIIHSLKVSDMPQMFSGCNSISFFPENFAKDWDWSRLEGATSTYFGNMSNLFTNCMKLREIPQELLIHGNPFGSYSYALTYMGFNNCYGLEKVENVFIPYKSTSMTINAFYNTVKSCCRLKKFTLQTQQDGTPYDVSGWKSQTIDLSTVGYGSITYMRLAGLTEETKIDNEEKWHGYIDGSYPDGWAESVEYSTFGATAVKEFIASLPSITGGSNNTIKLKQGAASAIPGEEMTSLTEEDIAVATEKGWTITFA